MGPRYVPVIQRRVIEPFTEVFDKVLAKSCPLCSGELRKITELEFRAAWTRGPHLPHGFCEDCQGFIGIYHDRVGVFIALTETVRVSRWRPRGRAA